MGSFANSLFIIMLGWLQAAVSAIWSVFTTENGGSLIKWIGNHWLPLAAILCIIGMTVDLAVYLVRWRPLRVWQSFFRRRRQRRGPEPDEAFPAPAQKQESHAGSSNRLFRERPEEREVRYEERFNRDAQEPADDTPAKSETDLSRWDQPEETADPMTDGHSAAALVTGAGYVVPEDSPYRRPAQTQKAETTTDVPSAPPAPESVPAAESLRASDKVKAIQPRRRRRLSVSELFGDPEEELLGVDAPQNLIDRHKAYHEPVYPTGWKKSEDGGNEPVD